MEPPPFNRRNSMVIAAYPWMTDTIVSRMDLPHYFGENHTSKGLLQCLLEFEGKDLTREDLDGIDLRNMLPVMTPSNGTATVNAGMPYKYKPVATAFAGSCFSYICANRLVDITSWVEGLPRQIQVPQHNQRTRIGKIPFQKWNTLNDWPNMLMKCLPTLTGDVGNLNINISSSVTPENQCFSLLSSIARRVETTNAMKILLNIEIAAMHISFMWKGLLDFPNKIDWFRTHSEHIDSDAMNFLEGLYNSKSSHRLKLPLQLALTISPLILFFPNQLWTKDWDRRALLQTSKALGNQRPESLIHTEKIIWTPIFRIARGETTSKDAIRDMIAQLPVDFLNSVSTSDRQWFPKQDDAATQGSLLKLYEADVDSPVPAGWPLLSRSGRPQIVKNDLVVISGVAPDSLQRNDLGRCDITTSTDPVPKEGTQSFVSSTSQGPSPTQSPESLQRSGSNTSYGSLPALSHKLHKQAASRPTPTQSHELHKKAVPLPSHRLLPAQSSNSPQIDNGPSTSNLRRSSRTTPNGAVDYSGNNFSVSRRSNHKGPQAASTPTPIQSHGLHKKAASLPSHRLSPAQSSKSNLRLSLRNTHNSAVDYSGNNSPFSRRNHKGLPRGLLPKHEAMPAFPPDAGSSVENPIDVEAIFICLQGRPPVTLNDNKISNKINKS